LIISSHVVAWPPRHIATLFGVEPTREDDSGKAADLPGGRTILDRTTHPVG
jgi:hypothetical protein